MDQFSLTLLKKLTTVGEQNVRLEKENTQLEKEVS